MGVAGMDEGDRDQNPDNPGGKKYRFGFSQMKLFFKDNQGIGGHKKYDRHYSE
jgi:hypothetical protein